MNRLGNLVNSSSGKKNFIFTVVVVITLIAVTILTILIILVVLTILIPIILITFINAASSPSLLCHTPNDNRARDARVCNTDEEKAEDGWTMTMITASQDHRYRWSVVMVPLATLLAHRICSKLRSGRPTSEGMHGKVAVSSELLQNTTMQHASSRANSKACRS